MYGHNDVQAFELKYPYFELTKIDLHHFLASTLRNNGEMNKWCEAFLNDDTKDLRISIDCAQMVNAQLISHHRDKKQNHPSLNAAIFF